MGSEVRRKQSQEISRLRWRRGISRRKSEVTIPTPRVWWANRKFLFVASEHFHHLNIFTTARQVILLTRPR